MRKTSRNLAKIFFDFSVLILDVNLKICLSLRTVNTFFFLYAR
jgi:hypothetical protein